MLQSTPDKTNMEERHMDRRYVAVFIMMIVLLMSGCQEKSFRAPQTELPYLIISHVKEPTFTFIDMAKRKVLFSEDSRYPITDMVKIDEGQFVATSRGEASLLLFDVNRGKIEPFLKLNEGLNALGYHPEKKQLYVTDVNNDKVHIIDAEKRKKVASFKVGAFPSEVEIVDQTVFVLNSDSHEVTVIKDGKKTGSFPVLERPSGMYFDGKLLWVGGHGPYGQLNNRVISYDPKTFEQVEEIELGLMPVAFYGERHSPYFYVLCHGNHALYKVDKNQLSVTAQVEVGQNPNFVTGNERALFVTNFDGHSLSIIDKQSFTKLDELSVPSGPYVAVVEE